MEQITMSKKARIILESIRQTDAANNFLEDSLLSSCCLKTYLRDSIL